MRTSLIPLVCLFLSACGADRPATGGQEGASDDGGEGGVGDPEGEGGGAGGGEGEGEGEGGSGGEQGEGEGGEGEGEPTPAFCGPFEARPERPDDDPPFDPNFVPCDPPCTGRTTCVPPGECVNTCQAPLDCPADVMRTILRADGGTFRIDAYEASRPDAGEAQPGCNQHNRPCSQPAVRPWSDVTWVEADAACTKVGKRLCTLDEWQAACESSCGFEYPYGDDFDRSACNGHGANPEGADFWETGRRDRCGSADWVFDLVGNAREWTSTVVEEGTYAIVGGSPRDQARSILSCAGEDIKSEGPENAPVFVGFRCCAD